LTTAPLFLRIDERRSGPTGGLGRFDARRLRQTPLIPQIDERRLPGTPPRDRNDGRRWQQTPLPSSIDEARRGSLLQEQDRIDSRHEMRHGFGVFVEDVEAKAVLAGG